MSVVDPALLELVRTRLAAGVGAAGRGPAFGVGGALGPGGLTDPGAGDAAAQVVAIQEILRSSGRVVDHVTLAALAQALRDELTGLGPVDVLVRDPQVTDILVNGPSEVWIDRGAGLVPAGVGFRDEAAVRQLAVRLAAQAGRRLDDAVPHVDARLPGGQRLHAVLPPLSVRGTAISLRIPRGRRFTIDDLVAAGTVDDAGAEWLAALIRSRCAFLISGGTGSGKTSILGALLGLVPGTERIVIVEDTCELAPDHPHVVSLESRPPNVEGVGEIPLRALVRQALRMRPDRLVVGEVRGAEVVDMLAGFNTGHEGGCGTVHANSAAAVPDRLVALALAADMSLAGVWAQMTAGLDVVVHLSRRPDGRRVVAELGVLSAGSSGGVPHVAPGLVRRDARLQPGPAYEALAERLGVAR